MKNITVRKIVLFSIGLLSAIMLLVGLSFAMTKVSYVGIKEGIDGFGSLSFELPESFKELVALLTQDNEFVGFYETMFAITSLLTLVSSILFIGIIVFAFFKFDKKKGEKTLVLLLVFSIIIAIVHAIFPIIFNVQMNSDMKNMLELLENSGDDYYALLLKGVKFQSSAFIALIFQVVLLVGYIVCSKLIKTCEPLGKKQVEEKTVAVKENAEKQQFQVEEVLSFEHSVIELLKEYKKLHDENIITAAEYMEKRVKIMNSANEKVKRLSGVMSKASFDDVVKAEKTVVNVLREYKKLAENQIISDADYISKKVVLLSCVIK